MYVPGAMVYHKVSSSLKYDSPMSVYYGHRNLEWVYLKNMPTRLIARTAVLHICYILFSFIFFSIRGQAGTFWKAKKDAFRQFKRLMEKRQSIQESKSVSDAYIWHLLEKESFMPRLIHRRASGAGRKKELL